MKQRLKLILMVLSIALALFALWQGQNVASQGRESGEAKIRLRAHATAVNIRLRHD